MVSTPNRLAPPIQALTQHILLAAKQEDWTRLKQLDLKVRALLEAHPECLHLPALQSDVAALRAAMQLAYSQLSSAVAEMKIELAHKQEQQERAKAYQLATTMEYTW